MDLVIVYKIDQYKVGILYFCPQQPVNKTLIYKTAKEHISHNLNINFFPQNILYMTLRFLKLFPNIQLFGVGLFIYIYFMMIKE